MAGHAVPILGAVHGLLAIGILVEAARLGMRVAPDATVATGQTVA